MGGGSFTMLKRVANSSKRSLNCLSDAQRHIITVAGNDGECAGILPITGYSDVTLSVLPWDFQGSNYFRFTPESVHSPQRASRPLYNTAAKERHYLITSSARPR